MSTHVRSTAWRYIGAALAIVALVAIGADPVSYASGDPLGVRLRIALAADLTADPSTYTWTDVSSDLRGQVVMTRGAADEQAETNSDLSFQLDDQSGRYTPDNAQSDIWPYWGIGTPVEFAVNLNDGSGWHVRSIAYVASVQDTFSDAGTPHKQRVAVAAAGLFRRLGQGQAVLSAIRGTVLAAQPDFYWPLEDAAGATQAASGLPGGKPMTIGGVSPPIFSQIDSSFGAATPAPDFTDGATLTSPLTGAPNTSSWRIEFSALFPIGGTTEESWIGWTTDSADYPIWTFGTSTSGLEAYVIYSGGSHGAVFLQFGLDSVYDGLWHRYTIDVSQSGADQVINAWVDGVQTATNITDATIDVGRLTGVVQINPHGLGATSDFPSIQHLAIWVPWADPGWSPITSDAGDGYAGELTSDRIIRMGNEGSFPYDITAGEGAALGPQPSGVTRLEIMRTAAKADFGILDDSMGVVEYRPVSDLFNQAVALSLDARNRELSFPFAPTRDDQQIRTRVRATRPTGGEAVAEDAAATVKYGLYDDDLDLNLASDDQLAPAAGFRLAQGLVAATTSRFPTMTLDLLNSPQLALVALALRNGDPINAINPPRRYTRDAIELLALGSIEGIAGSRRVWEIIYNVTRRTVWSVGVLDSDALGKLDTSGCTLTAALDGVAAVLGTTFTVTTPSGALWTTDSGEYPFDLYIAGQRITVSGCSSTTNPQTFTISVPSVNDVRKQIASGEAVRLWTPLRLAL